jgi:hypothetical protein
MPLEPSPRYPTWWLYRPWWRLCMDCGEKKTFGILVYSKEYTFRILLVSYSWKQQCRKHTNLGGGSDTSTNLI